MKLPQELKECWDECFYPSDWLTTIRLIVVLTVIESLICLVLIQIINALI